jgi:mRNA-degrading endonuclease RelE of RelBE toxin-antitoxin system
VSWKVVFSKKANKQLHELPETVRVKLDVLVYEIQASGPVRGNWKNYGKLSDQKHHCHLKSGQPTYVACWEVTDRIIRIVEIYYAGTHEKAPY